MKKTAFNALAQSLRRSLSFIAGTGRFYGDLGLAEESVTGDKGPLVLSSVLPFAFCVILLLVLGRGFSSPYLAVFLVYAAVTLFLAAGFFAVIGALFGRSRTYFYAVCAWTPTYWATALFLALLACSHFVPAIFNRTPGSLPTAVKYVFLALYLTAGFWKFFLMVSMLKYFYRLKGLRLFAAIVLSMAAFSGFALLSALIMGTKVPMV